MSTRSSPRERAFEAVFQQHWSAVHAYALRRTAGSDDAHDVAAETFTAAWRRFDELPDEHVLPWLYRTAANVLRNRDRSARRRLRLGGKVAALPPPRTEDPADIATDDQVLVAAFRSLADADREVLRLVAWEGLTNDEVALVLDVSTNAAALRLSRARKRLEEAIADAEADARTTRPPSGHARDDRDGTEAAPDRRNR